MFEYMLWGVWPSVHLTIPPHSARLCAWGKRGEEWFALLSWDEQTVDYRTSPFHRGLLFCTAWVAATHVRPWSEHERYDAVPRIALDNNPQTWPSALRLGKTSHPDDYYYGLIEGEKPQPPPGISWLGHPD